jgi:hypothetical protein
MQAIDVDDSLRKSWVKPKCKTATRAAAFPLGAAPTANGQLPSEPVPTPAIRESNAKMVEDLTLSRLEASNLILFSPHCPTRTVGISRQKGLKIQ